MGDPPNGRASGTPTRAIGRLVSPRALLFVACSLALSAAEATAQRPASSVPAAPSASPVEVGQDDNSAAQSSTITTRPAKLMQDQRVKRWAKVFSWALILLLIFAFAAIALVVFSRRFKDYLIRPARKPTQYVDVWQLHKLPPEGDEDINGRQGSNDDN